MWLGVVESNRERRMAPGPSFSGQDRGAAQKTQIQDQFSGVSLSRLSEMEPEEVLELISPWAVCPICGGRGCSVRLGFTGGR